MNEDYILTPLIITLLQIKKCEILMNGTINIRGHKHIKTTARCRGKFMFFIEMVENKNNDVHQAL